MEGTARIEGLEDAMAAMRAAFPSNPEQQRTTLNNAMKAAAVETIVIDAKLRAAASDASGALAESIGVRAKSRRRIRTARLAGGVEITPIRNNRRAMAKYINYYYTQRGWNPDGQVVIDGIRHGHLIEFGFTHKRSGKLIPAQPFLWPAATSKTGAYRKVFAKNLEKKTEAAVRRRARKSVKRTSARRPSAAKTATIVIR